MGRYTSGGVGRDILAGAIAGAAALWVVDKLDQAIYRAGGPQGVRRTEAARPGGMDPAHMLARRAADAVGVDVGDPKDNPAGHTIHYGIAAGMGALYGLLRGIAPGVSTGRGALFGIAAFIVQNEIGNTVTGTAGNPLNYPVRDHARGAATHTLFGIVTDLGTRLMSPWRDQVVIEQGPPLSKRLDHGRAYLSQGRDYVYEHGRQGLEQGREYLDQSIRYAGQFARQVSSRLPEVDTADVARRGRGYAGQVTDTVRSQVPGIDLAAAAKVGPRQAGRFVDDARPYVPEIPTSGISRAMKRLFG